MIWIIVFLALAVSAERIHSPPKNMTGIFSQSVQFQCGVEFGANKVLGWEYNGESIYDYQHGKESYPSGSEKFSVTMAGNTFTLTVKNLKYEDKGQYSCVLTQGKSVVYLVVIGKPNWKVLTPSQEDGELVVYECVAEFGSPDKDKMLPGQYPMLHALFDGSPVHAAVHETKLTHPSNQYIIRLVYYMELNISMNEKNLICELHTTNPIELSTNATKIMVKPRSLETLSPSKLSSDSWIVPAVFSGLSFSLLALLIIVVLIVLVLVRKGKMKFPPQISNRNPEKRDPDEGQNVNGADAGAGQQAKSHQNKEQGAQKNSNTTTSLETGVAQSSTTASSSPPPQMTKKKKVPTATLR